MRLILINFVDMWWTIQYYLCQRGYFLQLCVVSHDADAEIQHRKVYNCRMGDVFTNFAHSRCCRGFLKLVAKGCVTSNKPNDFCSLISDASSVHFLQNFCYRFKAVVTISDCELPWRTFDVSMCIQFC